MQCRSCGTVLQPGVVACPSCGAPTSSDTSDPSSYDSRENTIPPFAYAPFVETSSMSSSQKSHPNSQPPTNPQPYSGPQFHMGAQPFPDRDIQPFAGAVQQPVPIQQQRRGLSGVMIAVLVILTLLIVAVSGLTYYTLVILRPAQHQTKASARTPTISTTPTLTNPQALYTQATSGTLALNDPLSSQNPNGWEAIGGYGSCTFTGKALRASATHQVSTYTVSLCLATSTSFVNFAYQARTTIIQGDASGLIFRADPLSSSLYYFMIEHYGYYILESVQRDNLPQGNVKVLVGATSAAINTGLNQPNLLTVIARSSTIYLYVNQQYLSSIVDSTSSSGAIGVFGENTKNGPVDVAFSEIQVWKS